MPTHQGPQLLLDQPIEFRHRKRSLNPQAKLETPSLSIAAHDDSVVAVASGVESGSLGALDIVEHEQKLCMSSAVGYGFSLRDCCPGQRSAMSPEVEARYAREMRLVRFVPWRHEPMSGSRTERLLSWLVPGWIKLPFRSTKP